MRSLPELPSGPVAVDANALDAEEARGPLAGRFLRLAAVGEVAVFVPAGVREEVERAETPDAVRDTFLALPVAPPRFPTHEQKLDRMRVRAILRGDAPSAKHEADARNLSEAAEAGCAVFVTHDRRILRRRADLARALPGLRIMTLDKFLEAVERGIAPEEDGDW